jgi:hypothetical protein
MNTQEGRLWELGPSPQVTNNTFCYRVGHLKHFMVCKKRCPIGRDYWECRDYLRYDKNIRLIRAVQSLASNGFKQPLLSGMAEAYRLQPEPKEEE